MTSTGTSTRPPRILLAKNFLDSHDRAIGTIAIALRDAAMEVIMVEYQVPEDIASAAIDEDADVIGISFMSGGQVEVTQQLAARLREAGHEQLPVVVGGTIRPFDVPDLEKGGVKVRTLEAGPSARRMRPSERARRRMVAVRLVSGFSASC